MNKNNYQKEDEIKFSELCSKFKNRHLNILDVERIIYCEASGSYTWIHLINGNKIKVSCRIKKVEESLNSNNIIRIHHSYLANIKHILEISEHKPYLVKFINGTVLKVSVRKLKFLLEQSFQNI